MQQQQQQQDFVTRIAVQLAKLESSMEYIKSSVEDIVHKLEKNYVTQDQFEPIKRLVYGMVSIILVAVVGAIMAVILK